MDFTEILGKPKKFEFARLLKRKIVSVVYRCFANSKLLNCALGKTKKFKQKIEHHKFVKKMIANNYASEKEINAIQNKIENIIKKNTIKN